jgi:hypothetical protein
LICTAQEFVREKNGGERASASMRDVNRCLTVYRWFGLNFKKMGVKFSPSVKDRPDSPRSSGGDKDATPAAKFFACDESAREVIKSAVICSLAYTYQARLPRDMRRDFRVRVAKAVPHQTDAPWLQLDAQQFREVLKDVQGSLVGHMKLGEGIAPNEALCENLFMTLVSILNDIPIFIVGKPGSSKSLAMGLITDNLHGDASHNEFLKSLPAGNLSNTTHTPINDTQPTLTS